MLQFQEDQVFPKGVTLVTARVVARSTSAWYSTATINAGSSDGVQVYDPVVNGQGLVGRVTTVNANSAQVMLVTDQQSSVDAMIEPAMPPATPRASSKAASPATSRSTTWTRARR